MPAKCNSSRVPNKNWREFYKGKCLVEIKIEQLLEANVDGADIHVFCEEESKRSKVEQLGAKFVLRDPANTKDDMHWSDVVETLVSSLDVDDDESIAWAQVTTPLFTSYEYRKVFQCWDNIQNNPIECDKYDCITTVRPAPPFIVNAKGRPVNHNFGRWHEWSQDLEPWFTLECTIHIMLKKDYLKYSYHLGSKPYLYGSHSGEFDNMSIDIDNEEDFIIAQRLYEFSIRN